MTVKLNSKALAHARQLVKAGRVVRDDRDAWSEAAPTADQENRFLKKHGVTDYSKWFLGIDESKSEGTKGRYSFPFGDFANVRRGGLISLESRAAQNHHSAIAKASRKLIDEIDGGR
jgi:hypothetical protein